MSTTASPAGRRSAQRVRTRWLGAVCVLVVGIASASLTSDAVLSSPVSAAVSPTTTSAPPAEPSVRLMSSTFTSVTTISAGGNHACAIDLGAVYCWGHPGMNNSRLGAPDVLVPDTDRPVGVASVSGGFENAGSVTAVSAGGGHTCAIESGVVYCWGENTQGQLGDASTTERTQAVKVATTDDFANDGSVTAVSAGQNHTCAIEAGVAFCWGAQNNEWADADGRLGNGTTSDRNVPVRVSDVAAGFQNTNVTAIAAGGKHSCAIASGIVYCWGDQAQGKVGNGQTTFTVNGVSTAAKVLPGAEGFSNDGTVSALSVSAGHTCVVEGSPGTVYCWGNNSHGQIGNGQTTSGMDGVSTAAKVLPGAEGFSNDGTVSAVSAGVDQTCAVEGGKAFCWGDNTQGQLGDGGTTQRLSPVLVSTGGDMANTAAVTAVSTDRFIHNSRKTCALEAAAAYCWGSDAHGQLGTRSGGDTTASALVVGPVTLRPIGGGNQNNNNNNQQQPQNGVVLPPPPVTVDTTAPSTTQAPAPSVPAGPVQVAAPAAGQAPSLVTAQDAAALAQSPGAGAVLVDGVPVPAQVVTVAVPDAEVEPAQRTPEQVAAVQEAGAALVASFNEAAPDGAEPLVTVTNTETGAVVNGVLVDPRDGVTPVPVPVENVVLLAAEETRVLWAAGSGDAEPAPIASGALGVTEGGVVSAVAYGFPDGVAGEVVIFSTPTLLGGFTIDASGTFAGQLGLPPGLEPGEHTLVMTAGGYTTSLGLVVAAADDGLPAPVVKVLPATGETRNLALLVIAVMFLAAGVVLLTRRRGPRDGYHGA